MKTLLSLLALALYFEVWKFWNLRCRIKYVISWRKDIGLISEDAPLTFKGILKYGRWIASNRFSVWIMK